MIRINLLPQKRRIQSGAEGSQLWLFITMALVGLEIVGCFMLYSNKQEELANQKRKNAEMIVRIEKAKASVKDHDSVKAKLEQLRSREDAIAKLQNARTGPTAMLLEIARILTPGRGPTVDPEKLSQLRRENPLAVYNPTWDTRRLWIKKLIEESRVVSMDGQARDAEDVAELARRLSLSAYFYDVKMMPGKMSNDSKTNLSLMSFQMQTKVRY
ncbi:MAG TPA: PilN domain-containing protein [Polyangiaceae bacterium]|jgi:type IV pilus assembly protein PilN|nr:PilN domain-containing protein [Polyangiaceae bacterium]